MMQRSFERASGQLRPLKLIKDISEYAGGSVLFEIGKTKVLCSVTLQDGVPSFLRGTDTGWLTAEYAMLPMSTPRRTMRESSLIKRSGRSIEISRLIGRSLRAVVDRTLLGERTILIDCDVLQADGGTRTASITGAYCALRLAVAKWVAAGVLSRSILLDELAAISVGIVDGTPVLDLDFKEDTQAQVDFNFVLTRSGRVIEMQGAAERQPFSWEEFERMRALACQGVEQLFAFIDEHIDVTQENAPSSSATAHLGGSFDTTNAW